MYLLLKQILKLFNESELPNHLKIINEEFVNIVADII